ncbi:MAG TPA: urease subunit beta [Chloroflexota bacterium]|nr:urease subunit beta [Chloroflexota bacterium]
MAGGNRYILGSEPVEINRGRSTRRLLVRNTGDRPIQVGSHFHFFEVNRTLKFDRASSYGMRLDIPAGTAARFEPGDERSVSLVALGGDRTAIGFNGLVDGPLDAPGARERAIERAKSKGFLTE